jgi:hypothetical protein
MAGVILARGVQAQTLTVKPRLRVILDNDYAGDPDGLFQLAHHLASPSVDIACIIGSHIHVRDFLDDSATQADDAVRRVAEVCDRMTLTRRPDCIAGRNQALSQTAASPPGQAARRIIAEALRADVKTPLCYAAGAGLTDLAEAARLEPAIGPRIRLVWIGGPEYPDLTPGVPLRRDAEYNLTIDLAAAQFVFNDSDIDIWQIPRNVYRQMIISHAELATGLRQAGRLGDYLLAQLERVIVKMGGDLGETYILGDSPLVTLTALQSSFDADSASSPYVVRPTPRLSDDGHYIERPSGRPMRVYTQIDARLTFADMFAKFAVAGAPSNAA